MKKLIILSAIIFFGCAMVPNQEKNSIYDGAYAINSIDGKKIDFNTFKGKKLLLVNTASKCGFTPQYDGLQKLQEQYKNKLTVIGFPCNQFAGQEPGSASEISQFCKKNYGVTFLVTEKIEVKGENQHPIYQWLTQKEQNTLKNSSVQWNFQKYLLDEDGKLIKVFAPMTSPLSKKIVDLL